MRKLLSLVLLFVLLPGCGALAGAALGSVLCGPGDVACRSSLFASGARADAGFLTVGGERYATRMVHDCRTTDGRTLVLHDATDPTWSCLQRTGASGCSCVGWSQW